jgi:Transcriptional Coactivator p15 (PC4)
MWVSPNHPNPPRQHQAEPPQDSGERLAVYPRGKDQEMRISLSEYNGNPYVSMRLWERGRDGAWWPTRKGCSIRLGECADVAAVLQSVAADGRPARDDRGHQGGHQRRQEAPRQERPTSRASVPATPKGQGGGLPFDEFSGDGDN